MERIYLVPGFFGFADLGDFKYFGHVIDFLKARFAEEGREVALHVVSPPPTATLRRRALALHDAITETAGDDDPLHVVAHSSGGLDARLLLTPGVALADGLDVEEVARRVRTVVTVATPHHGTPAAAFFSTLHGRRLLQLLSLATVYTVRWGRLPIRILVPMARLFRRAEQRLGGGPDLLDEVYAGLLSQFSADRRDAVEAFFAQVGEDRGLVAQLTPDAMDAFAASAADRPGVRYGCVVTRARRPAVETTLRAGASPNAHAANAVYAGLWYLASRTPPERVPPLVDDAALSFGFDAPPSARSNDGIVPSRSQVHGQVLRTVRADHLDVLGHFGAPEDAHYDWLPSGSGFTRKQFEATWLDVLHFLEGHDPQHPD